MTPRPGPGPGPGPRPGEGWAPVGTAHRYGETLTLYERGAAHTRDPGDARPVMVCLHGLEDAWACWRPLARALADRFRPCPVDLPWRTGTTYRWRTRATAAHWVDAALDLAPVPVSVLVAHSLGATSVLQ